MSPDSADPWSGSERGDDASLPPVPAALPVVVPDDARELARDVEAWRREVRWQRRRRRVERWTGRDLRDRDMRGHRVPGRVVVGIVLLVGLIGATLVVFTPRNIRRPIPPAQLALAAPTNVPGTVGGLLPDADLTPIHGSLVAARDLRPAVIALVPANCGCASALKQLIAQAGASDLLPIDIVSTASQSTQLAALSGQLGSDNVVALRDMQAALFGPIHPTGLTVVPVHSDGVIAAIVGDFGAQTSVKPELERLTQPGFDQIAADSTGP